LGVAGLVVEGVGGGPRALVQLVGVARLAAAGLVGELVVGRGDRDVLRARVGDPQGPFGEVTVGLLLTRLQGVPGQGGVARQVALAGIEADLAGRARVFHADLAGRVTGYGWVRHPATGAPTGGTSQHRNALLTEYTERVAGRDESDQPSTSTSTSTHPTRRVFTPQEKVALVRQYDEAKSQGRGVAKRWREANNLQREHLSRWRREPAWPQDPAPPQGPGPPPDQGNPEPGRAVPDDLDLPEIGPVEAYTPDDLSPTHRSHTQQEKLALLTEYAHLERGQRSQWLRGHRLATSHMRHWRRACEEGRLGESDLPLLARPTRRVFTPQEKVALVRQYDEAKSRGRGQATRWREANALARAHLSNWRRELASQQDPASPPARHGNSEPGRAVPDDLDLPEIPDRQGAREEGQPGDGGLPPMARASRRVFTTPEKAALVRQYQEARSQGPDDARWWREANNVTRVQLSRWRRELASPQDPASLPARHGNSEPGCAVPEDLDLPEIGPVEASTPDDVQLTRRRRTQQEKLALLTEHAHLEWGKTGQWLQDRHLTSSHMSRWRRAWEEGRLGEDDLPPAARAPRRVFTTQEKAALLRQHDEAESQGPDDARRWLETNNLTRDHLSRWRQELAPRQDPAPLPGHGNPELSRAVPDYLDLPEIGPVEAYTLDDLPPTHRSYTRQEKFALLTEYAQLERGQAGRWLHDRHLTSSQLSIWRRDGEGRRLGEGDLPPAAHPRRRLFTTQEKAALVRQYQEAKSQGAVVAKRWREANNLTRELLRRWQQVRASPQEPAPPRSGHGNPDPIMVEVDPAGWEEFPPDARSQPVDTPMDGGEPSGVNEYVVDPMDSWWATTLASAASTPAAWDAWDVWDQGDNGQGTAEPDRHHDGSSSSLWNF
jgi:transposase-like protein